MSHPCKICAKKIGTIISWSHKCDVCSGLVCSKCYIMDCCNSCHNAIDKIIVIEGPKAKDPRLDHIEHLGLVVGKQSTDMKTALFDLKKQAYPKHPDAIINCSLITSDSQSLTFKNTDDLKNGKATFSTVDSYGFKGDAVRFVANPSKNANNKPPPTTLKRKPNHLLALFALATIGIGIFIIKYFYR